MKPWMRTAGITLATAAAVALAGVLALIYSGWYDSTATRPHTAPVNSVMDIALQRSISVRAAKVNVPSLDNPQQAIDGFQLFRAHCVQCHGAPGVAPEPFAMGLMPAPASLVDTARHWPAAEVYWVVRQGIKMTGMPAWQYRISDEDIWSVVAFMRVLPTLSPAEYRAWDSRHARPAASSEPAPAPASPAAELRLGDAQAGRQALQQYLCITCHAIPGVVGAKHHVGPPLGGIAHQRYIAGVLPNTPANMVRWLRDPTAIDPATAMPNLGISEQDARDIAAFLYTLDEPE
ncbi:c-type cytochrome [Bordetella petrii]|uniref:c-type cytochrome n=1 Tax=Bordetella petrii TaxID=94624 RepID=UPI001A96B4E9|nr:c-type cytochrome [Bordetella petrii]MBO1113515.1 c-type cytochrome [Bordetella petrii]